MKRVMSVRIGYEEYMIEPEDLGILMAIAARSPLIERPGRDWKKPFQIAPKPSHGLSFVSDITFVDFDPDALPTEHEEPLPPQAPAPASDDDIAF